MDVIGIVILMFFGIYGILEFFAKTLFSHKTKGAEDAVFSHRVLAVKNCEETIEGMIRTLLWEDIREPLIVLDLGSSDSTGAILDKLALEIDFMQVMGKAEYEDYLSKMAAELG